MKLIKATFKDLTDSQIVELMAKLKELPFNNDLDIIDLDSSWKDNEIAMKLYKASRKAKATFQEYVLNNKF